MRSIRLAVLALLVASAHAQTIVSSYPGAFLDISTGLGTAIAGVTDDSEHTITTTVGNPLFPAGNVRIGHNGVIGAGLTTGDFGFTNSAIATTGVPTGFAAGATSYLVPFWDDLYPVGGTSSTTLYWYEDTVNGILYIQWNADGHITAVAGQTITFQVQVFGNVAPAAPWIQYVYQDVFFGGTHAIYDRGLSATVGYVKGSTAAADRNVQWSFDTATLNDGMVLSVIPPFRMALTSPFGPGSLQVDFTEGPPLGTYFICVTLNSGAFPNGYFFGLSPSIIEVVNQANLGFPFVGPLGGSGAFTLGPISGIASGFTFYAVALSFDTSALDTPSSVSIPRTFTVP